MKSLQARPARIDGVFTSMGHCSVLAPPSKVVLLVFFPVIETASMASIPESSMDDAGQGTHTSTRTATIEGSHRDRETAFSWRRW